MPEPDFEGFEGAAPEPSAAPEAAGQPAAAGASGGAAPDAPAARHVTPRKPGVFIRRAPAVAAAVADADGPEVPAGVNRELAAGRGV